LTGKGRGLGWKVRAVSVVRRVSGSFAAFRMTARTSNGNCKDNGNGEIQGSLHCATDDEAVRRFGRDDVVFGVIGETPLEIAEAATG
jgi:hypothetical protein